MLVRYSWRASRGEDIIPYRHILRARIVTPPVTALRGDNRGEGTVTIEGDMVAGLRLRVTEGGVAVRACDLYARAMSRTLPN
eukprot:1192110-Prorocentrum_minimum.AAC.1